ncbi:MAG: AraC family transcriptional regulator [Opitutaceae bacterium]|jgi:AraC family L-rhamnose operon transcriptional activator RhaR
MIENFQSVLCDEPDMHLPGLHIVRFAVHQYSPMQATAEPRRHNLSQLVLYLQGEGVQQFGKASAQVKPGTLVAMPSGVAHAFKRTTAQPPVCLTIDFALGKAGLLRPTIAKIPRFELLNIRHQLRRLVKLQAGSSQSAQIEKAIMILQLLISLLRAAGWLESVDATLTERGESAIQRLIDGMDITIPLDDVVQRSGYHRDHLNRLVKSETGLTLGQLRAHRRLAKATELLAKGVQVTNVAVAVGLMDQSYFARWFRRQTGESPSRWSQRQLEGSVVVLAG